MTQVLSATIVLAFGAALVGFALLTVVRRPSAERFLRLFAGTARAHFVEQGTRVVVGLALVAFSPSMRYPRAFELFGWILIVTSTALMLLPWRWHHRFAQRVIPLVIRFLPGYAIGSLVLGAVILLAAVPALLR